MRLIIQEEHDMHCLLRVPVLLASTIVVSAPRGAAAQTEAGLRILALPEGQPIVCHALAPKPDDPPRLRAMVLREFMFAPPSTAGLPPGFPVLAPREVSVAWDSTGAPVMLNDETSQLMRGSETVLAVFDPDGTVVGRHIDIATDSARIADVLASGDVSRAREPGLMRPPVSRNLTPDEGTQARALAAWLWTRRCRGYT
jgi:hypothetical protein